jgi:hypothetical protein
MRKLFVIVLSTYAATMTALVIKNAIDIRFLVNATFDIATVIEQGQIDAEFVNIIDGLDEDD